MHDDQIHDLLRTIEADGEPDPAFANALFDRLNRAERAESQRRTPVLLLVAALLLTTLVAGLALGSGLVRLPFVVEASPSASPSDVAQASPTQAQQPTTGPSIAPSAAPSTEPNPDAIASRDVLFAEADGIRLRADPSDDAELVSTLRRGQLMGATGASTSSDGMTWYEVRIGPGTTTGWVAAGPDNAWLRVVTDGAIVFSCDGCAEDATVVSVTPFGDNAISPIEGEFAEWRWSPDGTRLAAVTGGTTIPSRLLTMAPDGSDRTELAIGVAPAWSPDGERLAWLGEDGVVIAADAGEGERSSLDIGPLRPGAPLWSPDGTRLAITASDPDQQIDPPTRLLLVPLDGGATMPLTEPGHFGGFTWAADGSRLGGVEIDLSGQTPVMAVVIPTDGSGPSELLDDTVVTVGPSWSPDGTRLAVATPSGLQIFDPADSSDGFLRVPVAAGESIGEIHWSPSGAWLLYSTSTGREPTLWIVAADGMSDPRQVSPSAAGGQQAEWQPILAPLP